MESNELEENNNGIKRGEVMEEPYCHVSHHLVAFIRSSFI